MGILGSRHLFGCQNFGIQAKGNEEGQSEELFLKSHSFYLIY